MKFIHFIDKYQLDSLLKNGILVKDCYRGQGILIYPEIDIKFKTYSFEQEIITSEEQSNKMTLDEKWERIGASELRQKNKEVIGIKVQIPDSYWPIKVFIDIKSEIALEFGKLLDDKATNGIKYSTGDPLTEVINRIESPRFLLEGSFVVKKEEDLKELMEKFRNAGGGIWGAHSFDCMLERDISPEFIVEFSEFENTHNIM